MTAKGNSSGADARRSAAGFRHHTWLARLNDELSVATRRLFQSQLVLRAASEREIRAQLPELEELSLFICRAASASTSARRAIRRAFNDPQCHWLSRSAVESGASGFFCHLLLRETAAPCHADACRLVLHVLLDPVLKNCYDRVLESGNSGSHRACEWRFQKPKYYAMACAGLWETLLPFLARGARQHAKVFGDILDELVQQQRRQQRTSMARVNCRLAQVAGGWRLLEAIGDTKTIEQSPHVHEVVPKILAFIVRWSVLCGDGESHDEAVVGDPHAQFYDFLMEKFFLDMQQFLFKCTNATSVARTALRSILQLHLSGDTVNKPAQQMRFAAFAAAACLLVKGLGFDASLLINHQSYGFASSSDGKLLMIIVGLVSHVDSVDVETILCVVHALLDRFDASTEEGGREELYWALYVVVSRQHLLDRQTLGNSASFTRLQERICSIDLEELQRMPVHWMEAVWKSCVGLGEDEVAAFIDEARIYRAAQVSEPTGHSPIAWDWLVERVPMRRVEQYTSMMAILGTPLVASLKLVEPSPTQPSDSAAEQTVRQLAKKRRRLRRDVVVLSDEHEESRQNALLLPEVMERICSYMSAKRLGRLALVCTAFARVARQDQLWRPLYMQLVHPLQLQCHHGVQYEHDWRRMYHAKHRAIQRMRDRQVSAARKAQREQQMAFQWHQDDHELRMSGTIASPQLCRECGCNQLSLSDEAAKNHRALHDKYRCPRPECRAGLTSAHAFKQHQKDRHLAQILDPPATSLPTGQATSNNTLSIIEKPVFKCTVHGCGRSYKSIKWLEKHVEHAHCAEANV